MTNQPDRHLRSYLPIPEVPKFGLTTYDAKDPDTQYPPIVPLRPPAGAPNVLLVLLDDVGFGASSAFGGPCHTPTFEKLAADGLKFNRFHTCALCAPTRQALMTGRNHHSVGMGNITEVATAAPGQSSLRPNTKAPLALTLKLNGYSTAMFGKCHEVPVWENNPMGPFEHWPAGGGGFEYFYGFVGGENNQYDPALFEGLTAVEPPATPEEGYHLTEDLADHAVNWIRQQKALMPDKPFFIYFSPGATHAPHHVPKEWADKYKGQFAHGWDRQRELTFAKQKALGVIPPDCDLTVRHAEIPAWDEMPAELKPVLEREMEIYAGFLEHTDYHVGRVIDAIWDQYPRMTELEVRSHLARLNFKGEDVFKETATLSGGELSRLRFAEILLERPNLLFLDEPTNHLDIYTRESLGQALAGYTGTLLLVTHDRYLMNSLACPILHLEDGKGVFYDGYAALMARTASSDTPHTGKKEEGTESKTQQRNPKEERRLRAEVRKQAKELEQRIEELGADILGMEESLSQPEVASDHLRLQEICDALGDARFEQNERYAQWEALLEEHGDLLE